MESVDQILTTYSRFLFNGLKQEEFNILKWLARKGPQNLSELNNFRRWSIKRYLYGSKRFLGLIPNEFVRSIPVNDKETKYDLTLKGLLAVLAVTRFENIHLVKTYKKFLEKKIKKTKLVNWSLDFIKHEITLIIGYHYLQGLDWTRFKFVELYWDNLEYNDMMSEIIANPIFFKKNYATDKYDYVKNEYLKLFFILNFCTIPISLGKQTNPVILKNDRTGREFIHRWYRYLNPDVNDKSLKEREQYETIEANVLKHYTKYLKSIEKEAREIVRRNGYDISSQN